MKKLLITLLILIVAGVAQATVIFNESFEYANQDGVPPIGWTTVNDSWLCGYQIQDHSRRPHTGSWYAYTNSAESWMFIPVYFSEQLQYRLSLWAISDGGYQIEIWAGNGATPDAMGQLLLSDIASSGTYDQFSTYINEMNDSYDYFGIHAVQSYCSDCILTIDDIVVEQIVQYDFIASPYELDTVMQAGATAVFYCKVRSLGFEDVTIYITPHTEYFTDIHFYIDGEMTNQFPIVQDETVTIRCTATLRPDVEPGDRCWVDVKFDIDCGCASALFTLWVTVAADGIEENYQEISLYPNPSTGNVTIEGNGTISIFNSLGQMVLTKEIIDTETIILEKGVYFVKRENGLTEKLIVR